MNNIYALSITVSTPMYVCYCESVILVCIESAPAAVTSSAGADEETTGTTAASSTAEAAAAAVPTAKPDIWI